MEGSCLICESTENLMIMCKYYELGRKKKKTNCMKMFQSCFNLKFPKRNAYGEVTKMCIQCMNKLTLCYDFHQSAVIAYDTMADINSWYSVVQPSRNEIKQCEMNEEESDVKKDDSFDDEDDILLNNFLQDDNTDFNTTEYNDNYQNNDETFSDCSTNTEEILIATGYYSQKKNKSKDTERPPLKDDCNECPVCGKKFFNTKLTNRHYVTHFPKDLCHLCGKTTSTMQGYVSHMKTHEEKTNKYFCEPCNKVFRSPGTLRGHIKYTHKRIKDMKCYQCSEVFAGSLPRLIHMHKVHNIVCDVYDCGKCDRKFYAKAALKRHLDRVHAKIVRYKCDICSVGYYQEGDMIRHMKYIHDDRDSVKCNICEKTFARPLNLQFHMKIHMNNKDFKCSYCDMAYVNKSSLIYHLKRQHKTHS